MVQSKEYNTELFPKVQEKDRIQPITLWNSLSTLEKNSLNLPQTKPHLVGRFFRSTLETKDLDVIDTISRKAKNTLVHNSESSYFDQKAPELERIAKQSILHLSKEYEQRRKPIEEITLDSFSQAVKEITGKDEKEWIRKREVNKKLVSQLEKLETQDYTDLACKFLGIEKKDITSSNFVEIRKKRNEFRVYIRKQIQKLKTCGEVALIDVCEDCSTRNNLLLQKSCTYRQCAICAHRYSKKWFWANAPKLIAFYRRNLDTTPIHIVLTKKSSKKFLGDSIVELQKDFKKLRNTEFWKERIVGSIYGIEATYNHETKETHPHVHILAFRKKWMSHENLKEMWKTITGDSSIVWIERVKDKRKRKIGECGVDEKYTEDGLVKGILECSKYCMKPGDLVNYDPQYTGEFILSIRGRNLRDFTGKLRGFKIEEKEFLFYESELKRLLRQEKEFDGHCLNCGSKNLKQYAVEISKDLQIIIKKEHNQAFLRNGVVKNE